MKKAWVSGLVAAFTLFTAAGCGEESGDAADNRSYYPVFEEKDLDSSWSMENATKVLLSDEESKIDGEGAAALKEGIKISEGGLYVISGKLTDGRIIADVERDEKLKIVFNGIDITSSVSAPFYISNGDATIILAENTENMLTDGSAYQYADHTVQEPNACFYGDDNITIVGPGKLTVNANFNNGIGTKDELRIASGTIKVYAVNNALKGNDCVLIKDADISIESQGDGIKSDEDTIEGHGFISILNSNVEIIAEDDGLQAVNFVSAEEGKIKISAEGKKVNCKGEINIAEEILK